MKKFIQLGFLSALALWDSLPGLLAASATQIPFPEALAKAAVVQTRLDHILENSLLLGNGDVNGVLYTSGDALLMRLTKNDVWDARVDTTNDPPLLKIDIQNKKLGGPIAGSMPSWDRPFPCPRVCAKLVLGANTTGSAWQPIRAEGRSNTWTNRAGAAVMSLEGGAGASCGYRLSGLDLPADRFPVLRVKLSGSANARYYIDVMASDQTALFGSKWIDSPAVPTERRFQLPAGKTAGSIVLYTWTVDGKPAENCFTEVAFEGTEKTVPIDLSKLQAAPRQSELDIQRAVASISPPGGGGNPIQIRALAQANVFLVRSDVPARLETVTATYLPPPQHGAEDGCEWVTQLLPGDADWPGMSFAVALAASGSTKTVAIVTSLDSPRPLADAIALARRTLNQAGSELIQQHEAAWAAFWSLSGVDLDDADLRAMWYRNLYSMRCVSKPGVEAIGLYAGLTNDEPPWHGSHTLNYNSEQTFWGWYICNHAELSEPYERMMRRYLPRARWFAKQTYGLNGAHYPHNVFTHEIPDPENCRSKNSRMHAFPPYAQTIGVSGHVVQNIWLHYKYYPDRRFLAEIAYPTLREVATFYAEFIGRCERTPQGKVILAPSYSPEHWSLAPDFKYNRDCAYDLAYARMTLNAAIEGAQKLGTDSSLAERFRQALASLPDYPTTREADPIVVDVRDAPPIEYNIAVPVVPVFPAEQITWFSTAAEKRLFTRTLERVKWSGYNSSILLPVAGARLSVPGAWAAMKKEFLKRSRPNGTITLLPGDGCGHFTEQFAASGAIAELLLQSVGDVVRILPAWPKEKPARFENLRAQGGFLVSAEQRDGQLTHLEISSTVGGPLRLLSPWADRPVSVAGRSQPLKADARGLIEVETQAGERLLMTSAQ